MNMYLLYKYMNIIFEKTMLCAPSINKIYDVKKIFFFHSFPLIKQKFPLNNI